MTTSLGRALAKTVDGQSWMKQKDGQWELMKKDVEPPAGQGSNEGLQLWHLFQHQAPGEPDHWALVVGREGEKAHVYQVKGKKLVVVLLLQRVCLHIIACLIFSFRLNKN
jgi:hypothetical protein